MINVNQITSYLSKLQPDAALQRYAMMHKDDPYIVSLALAESNRRKDTRMGAQMTTPQQPKVADQAIQGMASVDPMGNYAGTPMPETVGIGQLPAKNLAKMAGGGIVAFADGGETDDDYMYPPGEVVARMADGGMVPRYQTGGVLAGTEYEIPGMTQSDVYQKALQKVQEGRELSDIEKALLFASKPLTAAADVVASPVNLLRRVVRNPLDTSPLPSMTPVSDARARALGLDQTPTSAPSAPRTAPTAADLGPVPGSDERSILGGVPTGQRPAPAPLTERRPPLPAAPGAAPAAAGSAMPTTAEGVMALYKNMRDKVGTDMPESQRDLLKDIATTAQEQAQKNLETVELQQAARGKYGEEQEKRLKAREERLGREEAQLGPMALFQAGLAIMGGTSPHGLVNIAAGAQVGLKNYQMGIDKLSIARDKLDDAFGKLEDIRRSEGIMNDKERNAAMAEVDKAILQGKKDLYTANHEYFKMSREDANKAADAYLGVLKTQYEQTEQTKRANITAGAHDPLALYKALGGGDIEAGYKRAKVLATEPKSDQEFRQDWAKSAVLRSQYPNVEDFVRMMKGTAALQSGQQLNPADAALINKYLQPPR